MGTVSATVAADRAATDRDAYPAVLMKPLPMPRRAPPFFHRYYSTEHLPDMPALSVLILDVNGVFERAKVDRHGIPARKNAPAKAIVVSGERRAVECSVELDSATPGRGFVVSARFDCLVHDPVVLLQNGCLRATDPLESYLYTLKKLRSELTRYKAGELELVRGELTPVGQAEIDASQPSIPGMWARPSYITFDDVVNVEAEVSDG